MPPTTLKSTALLTKNLSQSSDKKPPEEIFKTVLHDINSFNKDKLRKKEVYLVGGPPETYLPSYVHSFAVVGAKKNTTNYRRTSPL